MSLRDLGVYNPLKADHPIVVSKDRCWICEATLAAGTRTALAPFQSSDETDSLTVEAKPVCATCFLRGKEVLTPIGRRIVSRIKEGDGSPYSVETTDGRQWKDEEVLPLPSYLP